MQALLSGLQQELAAVAAEETRRGQDAYFKGVIRHRGVKTPAVEAVCKQFLRHTKAQPAELRALGLALLREPLQVPARGQAQASSRGRRSRRG